MRKLNEFDIGWLSGFIDGEGCIMFEKQKRKENNKFSYRVRLVITQKDKDVLEYAKEVIGGGNIFMTSPKRYFPRHYYIYTATSGICKELFPQLKFKLKYKEERRKLAITFMKLIDEHRYKYNTSYESLDEIINKIPKNNPSVVV